MSVTRRGLLGLALASAGLAVASCSKEEPAAKVNTGRPGGYTAGTGMTNGWPLPDITLTDQLGKQSALREGRKNVTLVFFGYVNCPDICPAILADLSSALQRMDAAEAEQVDVVFITTDPARDNPVAIKNYLNRIDDRFIGLTGDLNVITKAAGELGITSEQTKKLPSGGYEITHGTQVIGFGKDLTAQVLWSQGTSVGDFKTDIALLVSKQK